MLPVVSRSLRVLGNTIRIARLDRNLPQSIVAERAGISLKTLSEIEKGSPATELGNLAAVLAAVGFGYPFKEFLAPARDATGMMLEESRMPLRVRRRHEG